MLYYHSVLFLEVHLYVFFAACHNIHGFYIADSTWDNDLDNDLYSNSIMTFDRKKEAYRMELLNDIDLLFDFHDLNEFKQKFPNMFDFF